MATVSKKKKRAFCQRMGGSLKLSILQSAMMRRYPSYSAELALDIGWCNIALLLLVADGWWDRLGTINK